MSGARGNRWRIILPLVLLGVTLPNIVRERVTFAQVWPAWRVMLLDVLLIAGGAALVAAIVAGVVAWRRGADA